MNHFFFCRSYSFLLGFLICISFSTIVKAQLPTEQDCAGAIPICDFISTTSSSTLGAGNYLNENNPATCLVPGEFNSTWFVFTVVQSGDLAFTIIPIDLTADYDWSLYNLTNASCSDIPTNDALQVSCNSSQYGVTGISSTGIGNSNGPGPTNAFNYLLPVNAGETYTLNISNWSTSNGGYSIDFSASSAVIFDTVPPHLQSVSPLDCNATSLTFTFSENILCSTVEDPDFILDGPGGPFALSGVSGSACASGGTQEKTYTINFIPALINGATYSFSLTGNAGYVTDLCGNVADSSTIVFTAPGPVAAIDSVHQPICSANSGTIFVSADSGILPYQFSINGDSAQSNGTFGNLSAGAYTITVTDSAGCSDTVAVTLVTGPGGVTASIITSTNLQCPNVCSGTIVAGGTGGTSPYTYSWSGLASTAGTVTDLCSGNYVVTITDASGCFDTASVFLTQPPNFMVTVLDLNEPSCAGLSDGSISVQVAGGNAPYVLSWTPTGGSGSTASNLAAGNYTLTLTDNQQCVYDTVIHLTEPLPVTIPSPDQTIICAGSTGSLTASVFGGTAPYQFLWEGSVTANPYVISPDADTSYSVVATDSHGCTSLPVTFPVTVEQVPLVDLGNDSIVCLGDSLYLSAHFAGAAYLWNDGSTEDHFTIHIAGLYWVNVYNSCFSSTDSLVADYTDCSSCVHYPTAFSPDGNQKNDIFHPLITCPVTQYNMQVFNRWGELIFETKDVDSGWDGRYDGKPATVGVYVWQVEYSGVRRATVFSEKLSGNVTVVR
jgi:gliding motility-associated-like protein